MLQGLTSAGVFGVEARKLLVPGGALPLTTELEALTLSLIEEARQSAYREKLPPPLEDSSPRFARRHIPMPKPERGELRRRRLGQATMMSHSGERRTTLHRESRRQPSVLQPSSRLGRSIRGLRLGSRRSSSSSDGNSLGKWMRSSSPASNRTKVSMTLVVVCFRPSITGM